MYTMKKRRVRVLDSYISYTDTRAGEDIVIFIHGNPTSSYVWRNIVPRVQGVARCIAPDLLGFGDSGKEPNHQYTFSDHYRYFCAWLDAIKLDGRYIFVCQELGSMVAFHWSRLHEDKVKAIIHMEGIVAPLKSYDDISVRRISESYRIMRSHPDFEKSTLDNNEFLEEFIRALPKTKYFNHQRDVAGYRTPFDRQGEVRRAMVTAIKEIPVIGDGPISVIDEVLHYNKWLAASDDLPKLFIDIEPGVLSPFVRNRTRNWPNHEVIKVKGHVVPQEESPEAISFAIVDFVRRNQDDTV